MIPLKAIFVISVLISGLIFSPSYSFAQSNQDENPLSSFLEFFRQLFSFDGDSEPVTEFRDAVIVQTSGTSSTDTTPNNIAPIADAGNDQTVMEFENVMLDGSSSTDVDGTIVSYQWTQVSDPELSSTSVANPTFVAPEVESEDIVLRFSLKVTDNSGDTTTDEVDITVKNMNSPPIANAGLNQTVLEFSTVTLDGTSSTDVDGTIVSYNWTQVNGTLVTLLNNNTSKPTFEAPDVTIQEILTFMLAVVDNSSGTDTDEVNITVNEIDDGLGGDVPVDDGPENNDNDGKNKVTICHIPPGNPENAHTITVGEPAVITHMTKHGDTLGECPPLFGENSENNSNDGNKSNKENKGNSGKGNSSIDNSGKGNKNDKDENENKKDNSAKGNSGLDNSGKENKNNKKDDNQKSNSGKGNKDDNGNKSNSKLKNNNDDEAKVEDNEHEDEDDDEDEDEDDDEDEDE